MVVALFFLAPQIFAEIVVEKPDLPQGYESWPHQLKHSCGDLTENVYGRFDKEKKTIEFVFVYSVGDKVFSFQHDGGDLNRPFFMSWYLQKNSQWLKFNVLSAKERIVYADEFFKTLEQLGMNELFYSENCKKLFNDELSNFFYKLFEEFNKK